MKNGDRERKWINCANTTNYKKELSFVPRSELLRKFCDCSTFSIPDLKDKSEINKILCCCIMNITSSDSKVTVRLSPVLLTDFSANSQ